MSGHVADSLMNMETVRAFAAEEREAAEHRARVAESRRLSLRSWDYGNLRIDSHRPRSAPREPARRTPS